MGSGKEEREAWGNHCEFFLSSLGLAVGLGNVWRFPYVCYTNGGGSFLIPYTAMLFLVGLPAFFWEQSAGQYSRVGANKVFGRMVPAFKGLGYAMIFVRFLINIYYVVICAWAFFYLFEGFRTNLPWDGCENEHWNTPNCFKLELDEKCHNEVSNFTTYYNRNCTDNEEYCLSHGFNYNASYVDPEVGTYGTCVNRTTLEEFNMTMVLRNFSISPAEDYFNGFVLGVTKRDAGEVENPEDRYFSFGDYGKPQWKIVLYLLLSWVLICLSLIKGIQSYGKVSYVITLSPYFVLTALLIYAAQLPGAGKGIAFFFTPEWSKLADVKIWAKAASQIFFSLSVGFGSQLVLSSYNNFRNNTLRDSVLIGLCNSLTSIYAGVVVFAILGFIAHEQNTDDIGDGKFSGQKMI